MRHVITTLLFLIAGHISEAEAIIIRVELTPDLDEVDVPVFHGKATGLYFPDPVDSATLGNKRDYDLKPTTNNVNSVTLNVKTRSPPTNANIETWSHRVSVRFFMAATENKAASRVEFYDPGTLPVEEPGQVGEDIVHVSAWTAHVIDFGTPAKASWHQDGYRLQAKTGFTQHTKHAAMVPIILRDVGRRRFPIADFELRDQADRPIDATLVKGGAPGILEPGEQISIVFHVRNPSLLRSGWSMIIKPSTSIASARLSFSAEDQQRGAWQDRLMVAVRALGGAGNIDDGVGNDRTGWAMVHGLGARVLYGFTRYLSIEGELNVTRTQPITFTDSTWEQDMGDLQITETAGHVMAGGVLHTSGRKWSPFTRLALGVRLSQHMATMGSRDESEVRAGLVASLGGGLNVRLGKRLSAGISVAYMAPLGGNDTTAMFEGGIHLGAVWDLSSNHWQ